METNKPALKALSSLVIIVCLIFFFEKKYLVYELRGETLTHYKSVEWSDKVVLLIDDFEGIPNDTASIQKASFFSYGSVKLNIDSVQTDNDLIASKHCLLINWTGKDNYGGWGKGVGKNVDLNTESDYMNFRIFVPKSNGDNDTLKIMLEEDDNYNGTLDPEQDDSWYYKLNLSGSDKWQLISIPLKEFKDNNAPGDGTLNISRKGGLHTIIFSHEQPGRYTTDNKWYLDFICFTNQKITG